MQLPDSTIVRHGRSAYDPAKAHEYYLRTRQLKGRKAASPTYTVRTGRKSVTLTGRQLAEQKANVAERISAIKTKLAELTVKINKLVSETKKNTSETKREAKKAPTASEKSEAARESEKYRDKHKQELSTKRKTDSTNKSAKSKSEKDAVVALEVKISEVKDRLTAAVARQRALAGATRNR